MDIQTFSHYKGINGCQGIEYLGLPVIRIKVERVSTQHDPGTGPSSTQQCTEVAP